MTAPPLLEADGIDLALGGAAILRGAGLCAQPGRLVAVLGPNGAGKSTLLRVAAGLRAPDAGAVRWSGRPASQLGPRRLARLRAYLPQRPAAPDGVTVHEAVAAGRAPHVGVLRRPTARDREVVGAALRRAGVEALAERRLSTLSGGELQRTAIALALAQETPALLADEPTAALDLGATAQAATLLRELADDGLAVVVVLHDLALAAAIADEVVVLSGGRAVASGAPDAVLDRDLLAEVWRVEAGLERGADGATALRVRWLGGAPTAGG